MPLPKKPPKPAPPWLVSFADLQQLLLVFFILLFSMSSVDAAKFEAAMSSVQSVLNSPGAEVLDGSKKTAIDIKTNNTENKKEMESIAQQKAEQLEKEFKEVTSFLESNSVGSTSLSEYVNAFKTDEGIILRISDVMLFDSGSADIKGNSKEFLDKIGALIKNKNGEIRIEGHTDNVPINSQKYSNNWELSTSRATTVVSFLLENRIISPSKLAIAGYGEYRPIASNNTSVNKAKNRRVDIVLISDFSEIENPTKGGE